MASSAERRALFNLIDKLDALQARSPFGRVFHSWSQGALWITGPNSTLSKFCTSSASEHLLRLLDGGDTSQIASVLGLDYALVGVSFVSSNLYLARGAMGRPTLYAHLDKNSISLSTNLVPYLRSQPINPGYFVDFMATALLPAPVDINHTCVTPLSSWIRVPRAAVLIINPEYGTCVRYDAPLGSDKSSNKLEAAAYLQSEIDAHLKGCLLYTSDAADE